MQPSQTTTREWYSRRWYNMTTTGEILLKYTINKNTPKHSPSVLTRTRLGANTIILTPNLTHMERTTIRGSKALAERLGVSRWTVYQWHKEGILKSAILSEFRRIIIYDLEKVYECLNHRPAKAGRRAAI